MPPLASLVASAPLAASASLGTSCTWPSVIMIAPAKRRRGTVAERAVFERLEQPRAAVAVSKFSASPPVRTTRSSRSGSAWPASTRCASARLGLGLAVADRLAGRLVDHDDADILAQLALLVDERRVGQGQPQGGARRGRRQPTPRARRIRVKPSAASTARRARSARNQGSSGANATVKPFSIMLASTRDHDWRYITSRHRETAKRSWRSRARRSDDRWIASPSARNDAIIVRHISALADTPASTGRAARGSTARAPGRSCSCRSACTSRD